MIRRTFVMAAALALVVGLGQASAEDKKTEKGKTHDGKVVKVSEGKLTMTGKDGKEHTHDVGSEAKVMIAGKAGKLEDLKAGDAITVTLHGKGDKAMVMKIESKKADSTDKDNK